MLFQKAGYEVSCRGQWREEGEGGTLSEAVASLWGLLSPVGCGDGGGFWGTTLLFLYFCTSSGLWLSCSLLMSLSRVDVRASIACSRSDSFFNPSGSSSFSVCKAQGRWQLGVWGRDMGTCSPGEAERWGRAL